MNVVLLQPLCLRKLPESPVARVTNGPLSPESRLEICIPEHAGEPFGLCSFRVSLLWSIFLGPSNKNTQIFCLQV